MADSYKEFDKSPIVDTSDVVIKGFRFRVRELALGIGLVVCLLVIIILAALLGSANSSGSNSDGHASGQTGNDSCKGQGQCLPCQGQCFSPPCLKTAAHVSELMDPTTDPCDDFHTFACGGFPRLHPLVPYEQSMSTFQLIYDKNQERLRALLEQEKNLSAMADGNYEKKLRTFFDTCRDHYTKMQLQGRPLIEQMITTSGGWWALMGDGQWAGGGGYDFQRQLRLVHVDYWTDAFFTFGITTDWLDWNKRAIQIDLSGMGLPYNHFYDSFYSDELMAYKKYIRTVGELLLRDAHVTLSQAEKNYRLSTFVNDAFFVESELAKLKRESRSTENPHGAENREKLSDLNAFSGGAVDWVGLFSYMFQDAGVNADTEVVVLEKEYLQNFTRWINDLPSANKSRILNNYLIWRLADHYDQDLSWDYIHANRQIYVDLTGRAEFLGTWRYCVYKVDIDMKEALGALFIQNHFSDANKKTAHLITDELKTTLLDSLSKASWMSSATKGKAMQKLKSSVMELGYPEYLTNEKDLNAFYSQLKIGQDYFQNILAFNTFYRARWNQILKAPSDRTVWPYAAYDFVAHYYSPWKRLYVPAGLLQFPIYDHTSPRYINFGSMGTIVGGQIFHAVDEYGNYYSLDGSGYESWWSNETTQHYMAIRQCMMDALKGITMGPYDTPSGQRMVPLDAYYFAPLALGDSSSVKLALMAYHKGMKSTGEQTLPGGKFTNDQSFFISYAQTYCRTRDPERERQTINGGRTPPEKVRVNAALAQVPEFQEAFKCSAQSKMVAPKRCSFF